LKYLIFAGNENHINGSQGLNQNCRKGDTTDSHLRYAKSPVHKPGIKNDIQEKSNNQIITVSLCISACIENRVKDAVDQKKDCSVQDDIHILNGDIQIFVRSPQDDKESRSDQESKDG